MVAFLSATYVSAKKAGPYYFYGRSYDNTFTKIYGFYNLGNCVSFTEDEGICAYYLVTTTTGVVPDKFTDYQARYWVQTGYLIPAPWRNGIYLTD